MGEQSALYSCIKSIVKKMNVDRQDSKNQQSEQDTLPSSSGHFGQYGGMYVPETLMTPLFELNAAYREAMGDPAYKMQLESI